MSEQNYGAFGKTKYSKSYILDPETELEPETEPEPETELVTEPRAGANRKAKLHVNSKILTSNYLNNLKTNLNSSLSEKASLKNCILTCKFIMKNELTNFSLRGIKASKKDNM